MSSNDRMWRITYERKSEGGDIKRGYIDVASADAPDFEYAAQIVRKSEFIGPWLVPDVPRTESQPTVYQLRLYGIHIVTIEEVNED